MAVAVQIEHKDGKKLLHQRQKWKFMMFNGTFLSQLWVNEDPVQRSITFDLWVVSPISLPLLFFALFEILSHIAVGMLW
jgi:hypothetical protein